MTKVKTSVYIDEDSWERFRKHSSAEGREISQLLEEAIEEEMLDHYLVGILSEVAGPRKDELDFEPVRAKGGVSELVRVGRDERADRLSR